jgi:hypothetical protein
MDFITDLLYSEDPALGQTYDGILVVVDRLTKYAHFVPYRKTFTALQVAIIIINRCFRIHGILRKFVTDRDKLFTSNF